MKGLKALFLLSQFAMLLLSQGNLYAQQVPKIEWQKCLGGTLPEKANSIIQTQDGNYVIAGYTCSEDGFVSGYHGGVSDAWVINIDFNGNIIWQKCLGGTGLDAANCVIQTSDGGYIVGGVTWSNDYDVLGNHGNADGWVIKLDFLGNIEWQKCLGGKANDEVSFIVESKFEEGGGFIIVGSTSSNDGDVSGGHSSASGSDSADVWVVKLSTKGKIEWQKCLGGSGDDRANSVVQTSDHGYTIAGTSNSRDGDVSGYHIGKYSSPDAWIIKLDAQGVMQWQNCFGGSKADYAQSIIQTSDGGYAVAGSTNSNDGDVSGYHGDPFGVNADDAWLIKLGSSGTLQWQKCLGGSWGDAANSIIQTLDGEYVIAGRTSSNDGDVIGKFLPEDEDSWIVKLDSARHIVWQKCLGGKNQDFANSVIQTTDGGYVFAGTTSSNDHDVSGNNSSAGVSDMWVVKLGPDSAKANVGESPNPYLGQTAYSQVYPNPSWDQVHLQLLKTQTVQKVEFYDIMGRQQTPSYHLDNNEVIVDVNNLPPGTYFARVTYLYKGYIGTFTLPLVVQR